MQQNQPANFKNRIGFVLASVGSAVGMGNIWMFPYRVGQYGGAAFLLIYFGFVALFGWVGLSGEFAFGRLTGTGPIGSYAYALRSRGKKGGGVLGAIPLLGSLGIAIGYAVIVGWVVRYCWGSVSGSLFAVGSEEYFGQITGPFGSLLWHGVVVLVTVLVLARGVLQGIEKVNRIIMPAFFVLFLDVAFSVRVDNKGIGGVLVPIGFQNFRTAVIGRCTAPRESRYGGKRHDRLICLIPTDDQIPYFCFTAVDKPVIEPRHILCVGENQLIVGSIFYRLVEQQTHFFGVCIALFHVDFRPLK